MGRVPRRGGNGGGAGLDGVVEGGSERSRGIEVEEGGSKEARSKWDEEGKVGAAEVSEVW